MPRSQGWWWCCLTQQRSPPRWACCNDNQISIIIVPLAKCNTRRTPPPLHTHTHSKGGLYTCFPTLPFVADPLRRWWDGTLEWQKKQHCQHTQDTANERTSAQARERCGICSSTCKMHFTFSLGARGARAGRAEGSLQQCLIFSRSSFCAPGFLFFPFVPSRWPTSCFVRALPYLFAGHFRGITPHNPSSPFARKKM